MIFQMASNSLVGVVDWAGGTWWGRVVYADGRAWVPLFEGKRTSQLARLAWKNTVLLSSVAKRNGQKIPKNARIGASVSRYGHQKIEA